MPASFFDNPAWLRAQAARCLVLARDAGSEDLRRFLLKTAQECSADAANLAVAPEWQKGLLRRGPL